MKCPHCGICVDPRFISECDLNGCIFSFLDEKKQFDNLSDLYPVRARNGDLLKFKNRNQRDFYLTDFGGNEVLTP